MGYIYGLIDPETSLICYIGQTKETPKKRFYKHKYRWKREKYLSNLNSWIKDLYMKGLFPKIEIIEEDINEEDLNCKEISYINLFKSFGANLVNTAPGGSYIPDIKQNQIKRLKTLETSILWKESRVRQKEAMIELHKGDRKIGFRAMSKEELQELNRKNQGKCNKSVLLIDDLGNILKEFPSIKEAAAKCGIKDSTHIVRVCKGKSKSGKTYGMKFIYKPKPAAKK